MGLHGGSLVSTVLSQQEDPGFDPDAGGWGLFAGFLSVRLCGPAPTVK